MSIVQLAACAAGHRQRGIKEFATGNFFMQKYVAMPTFTQPRLLKIKTHPYFFLNPIGTAK